MRVHVRPAALGLALALGLVGCGEGKGDEEQVTSTVNGVYDALADKDADQVCDSLSAAGKRQITRGADRSLSCEEVFKRGLSLAGDALKDAKRAEVTQVKVEGDKATASVKYKKETGKVELLKEDGKWKLNDLGSAGG
ncbi:MAG TPA: nuclear transport factor 2 family protein [Thermoleophilaceae bacterium]|nr:nuclear transport factor 2 family protein [Thermoleophilaceae bacterium]